MEKGIKGIALFRTVFIVPIMIAPVVVGLIWRYLFDANFGLINYIVQLVGFEPKVWLGTPGLALARRHRYGYLAVDPFYVHSLSRRPAEPAEQPGRGCAGGRSIDLAGHPPGEASSPCPVIWVAIILRMIDAFRSLEVMYIMTFGGPGRETEVLSLNIYKTAF